MIDKYKKFNLSLSKILIYISIILLIFTLNYYISFSYKSLTNNFYTSFSKRDFENAKEILSKDKIITSIKKHKLNKDLTVYFTSIITDLCSQMANGSIDNGSALTVLKEINTYGFINSSLDKLIISLDETYTPLHSSTYNYFLELGITHYNNKDFAKAISTLKKIPNSEDEYFSEAESYIDKCISDYKSELFESADELIANKYFTKAIELLTAADSNILSSDDIDISNKIRFISSAREEYLASAHLEDEVYTSNAILQSITLENINTLNIDSKTPYFLYVNLGEQKTYVYEGSVNDWDLLKTMDCSTGIDGEETPKGVYSITSRGDWFFSEEYDQGGKYWVQFMGDYLFHSLPYDITQSNILDYTLGVPASHGCIRLNTEDAKWIYDNVSDDTKVVIN